MAHLLEVDAAVRCRKLALLGTCRGVCGAPAVHIVCRVGIVYCRCIWYCKIVMQTIEAEMCNGSAYNPEGFTVHSWPAEDTPIVDRWLTQN